MIIIKPKITQLQGLLVETARQETKMLLSDCASSQVHMDSEVVETLTQFLEPKMLAVVSSRTSDRLKF